GLLLSRLLTNRLLRSGSLVAGLGRLGRPAFDYALLLFGHRILALSEPAWPRNSRVGANSPSLCPTIDSDTKTGTCLRPSWTAMVWPTISGKIVDIRDQVLIICFWPEEFMASIRPNRRSSTHGPFLDERLKALTYLFFRRRRTIMRSDCLFFLRVG